MLLKKTGYQESDLWSVEVEEYTYGGINKTLHQLCRIKVGDTLITSLDIHMDNIVIIKISSVENMISILLTKGYTTRDVSRILGVTQTYVCRVRRLMEKVK